VSDLLIHLLLFGVVSFAIVLMGSFFSETDDARALRSLPRRLAVFLFGCAVLAGIMLAVEHTFAAVS
jgi:hypothetical protein